MASVSDDALTKVTRLFNASINHIIAELLQNARRSGATEVVIECIDDPAIGPAIAALQHECLPQRRTSPILHSTGS